MSYLKMAYLKYIQWFHIMIFFFLTKYEQNNQNLIILNFLKHQLKYFLILYLIIRKNGNSYFIQFLKLNDYNK